MEAAILEEIIEKLERDVEWHISEVARIYAGQLLKVIDDLQDRELNKMAKHYGELGD